jgi:hypothetical protein
MATPSHGKLGGKHKTIIPDYSITEWNGLNNYIQDLKMLKDGESPASLNWVTGRYKDNISLRGGTAQLGSQPALTGNGRVTGLGIGVTHNNVQVPFYTYAQKIMYYNITTGMFAEAGTNILPAAANGEDTCIMPYQNIAGDFVYITSPNSSIYKIPVVNPSSVVDLFGGAGLPANFRGHASINSNIMFMWQRNDAYGNKYEDVLYQSCTDGAQILSSYINETAQAITTTAGQTAYSGTLPSIPSPIDTVFNVEIAGATTGGVAVTTISMASNAAVQTATPHGLTVGQAVFITGVSGMTQINGLIGFVTNVGTNTVVLSINSSAFTAYSSGGTIYGCEYWIDDKNGNMNSSAGGTGTINYATGAYSINFVTAPSQIFAQYYAEQATNKGIADFVSTGSSFYNQFDGGGDIQALFPFDQVLYSLHLTKSWYVNVNPSAPTNLPYRSQLGTPYLRGGFATDDGIVFIDTSLPSQPKIKVLEIDNNSATAVVTVVPASLSDTLNLSQYGFGQAVVFRWGDYDLVACEATLNAVVQGQNAIMFARNIYSQQWDMLDIPASCMAEFNGVLIAGDSFTNNVYQLFSGFDDLGSLIENYWQSKLFDLGVPGIKQFNRFVVKGLIQQTQNIDVYFSFDQGAFTKFATIYGNGTYVNVGNPQTVGSRTAGGNVVGGGEVVSAYEFEYEFPVMGPRFQYVQVQFIANNIGFCEIDQATFKDCRYKGRKLLNGLPT